MKTLARRVKEAAKSWLFVTTVRFILPGRYKRHLERIRLNVRQGKRIRILFLSSETAKWKIQGLFRLLCSDKRFDPFVVICPMSAAARNDLGLLSKKLADLRSFHVQMGNPTLNGIDGSGSPVPLSFFSPDIVWFDQPWMLFPSNEPMTVSRFALTCYQPYFVPNYEKFPETCFLPFHRCLFEMMVMNDQLANGYRVDIGSRAYAAHFISVGHTALDLIRSSNPEERFRDCVIYAPHWSFIHPNNPNWECFSTFLQNGREILAYAKNHKEIQWVFKPHPSLAEQLVRKKVWTDSEVSSYYDEWQKLGTVCLDGDYQSLFASARAMVTDCGSFLTEFAATGRPIIHLLPFPRRTYPSEAMAPLFNTFYQVQNLETMYRAFDEIIVHGKDPQRDTRLAMVRAYGLQNSDAARRIVLHLENLFCLKP